MIPSTKPILFATFFWALLSCGQQPKDSINVSNAKIEDTYKPAYTAAEFNDKLEFSFKHARPDSLDQLFTDWNRTIKPNSEDFIHQNDTIHAVFDIYKAFYKPLDLLKLGDWEWGNELNSKCKYVVVQNKLFYSIVLTDNFDDFDWEKSRKDSIENFRPPIDLDKNKVLYLTNEYATSINKFLGTESTELGEGNIMNPSRPAGESETRYSVLRAFIPILHGHWGGYWHLETHPDVRSSTKH